jgi:alkylation response protein AidB-like acyl-CoA dehydrogenase
MDYEIERRRPMRETAAGDLVLPEPDQYRRQARAWLAENLQRRDGPAEFKNIYDYDPSTLDQNRSLQRRLYEGGYAGITWPQEYGGRGFPLAYEAAFRAEADGYVLPDFSRLTGTTFSVNVPTILAHAAPEFLRSFIPEVLAGEALVCQFFSEPSGGSDLAGARTQARRDGDQWVLSGQKTWSTQAHLADWGLCLARTDWDVPKHRGLTWFVVPCGSPGLTIRPIRQLDGTASFCEDFFDDVVVPDSYRVGEINGGWTVAQTMLVFERGANRSDGGGDLGGPGPLASDLVAIARRAGSLDDPVVRQQLARAHTIDFAGRALAWRIAKAGESAGFNPGLAAYGKLFTGTYNPIRAHVGVEIGGQGAMTWDARDPHGDDVSVAYLNGRIMSIAGGTNEMQRNAISERVLGLPRELSVDTQKPYREVVRDARNWATRT